MNSTEVETKYISFGYAVERNAILYDDDCFVTLTSDVLDIVAKNQHQCDAATYRSEWQGKIGQLVYLYDACRGRLFKHRVILHPDMGDDDDVDYYSPYGNRDQFRPPLKSFLILSAENKNIYNLEEQYETGYDSRNRHGRHQQRLYSP